MDMFAARIDSQNALSGELSVNLFGDEFTSGSAVTELPDSYIGSSAIGLRINRNTVLAGSGGYYAVDADGN